jgi:hypothetical protein
MDVSTNSIKGKKYRFSFSSRCFRSLLEYLYTGQILGALKTLAYMSVRAPFSGRHLLKQMLNESGCNYGLVPVTRPTPLQRLRRQRMA